MELHLYMTMIHYVENFHNRFVQIYVLVWIYRPYTRKYNTTMISHDLKFIFIHIPKTAGNSLTLFLKFYLSNRTLQHENPMGPQDGMTVFCEKNNQGIKHESITYYINQYGDSIQDYVWFTIVRNPYDRLLSLYFFTKGKDNAVFIRDEFVSFIQNDENHQWKYIEYNGKLVCRIVHYENMLEELKEIPCLQRMDFSHYPQINQSMNSKLDYKTLLDDDVKDLIYKKYRMDFDLFGYEH